MCFLCILIPVVVGLVCALLGYMLAGMKYKPIINKLNDDLAACGSEKQDLLTLNTSFKNDIEALKNKYSILESEFNDYRLNFKAALPENVPFDPVLASSVFKRKIVEDDLKIVEGIGPKIEELFHAAGIRTWRALAATSVERCRQILDEAGERYRIHKPDTWPKQCELAALGKWNELKEWQETLTGGREEI
ncbi:MAG TPA: hypothetical protein PLX08_11765 [Bacteroidales bacterium]|jgi:predicted flap endonuclease-1-like 5' DNA nuclease|nr:hypothetical protein [Bacteroidales bacterium]